MHVEEKDHQLIIQTRLRSLFFLLIFSLAFVLGGLLVWWIGGRTAALECTRLEAREVRCEVKETLLDWVVRHEDVLNPQQAVVEISTDSDGTTYRVALSTARDTVPLSESYASDAPAESLSTEINQFLNDTADRALNITQPPSPWIYLFPLCFGGMGLFLILAFSFETYTFDRDQDALLIERKSLHGTRRSEEPLGGLNISVRDHSDSDSTSYRVHVQTQSGRDITLGSFTSQHGAQQLAQRIEDFIKPGVHIRYADMDEGSNPSRL